MYEDFEKLYRRHLEAQAAAIKGLRVNAGLSQATLAKRIRASVWAVSSWEQARRSPSPEMQARLCVALNVSRDRLFGQGADSTASTDES